MKKLLTILALVAITITSMSAKSANVQLNTEVDESPVAYELSYNNDKIEDGTEKYDIFVSRSLTEGGQTQDFTIYASSNMNKDLSVKVEIKPESFKTTLNGSEVSDSRITPQVNTINKESSLKAGLNKNKLVNKFNLSWGGNKELPAGEYVSNVKINYTID